MEENAKPKGDLTQLYTIFGGISGAIITAGISLFSIVNRKILEFRERILKGGTQIQSQLTRPGLFRKKGN